LEAAASEMSDAFVIKISVVMALRTACIINDI